MCLSQIWFDQSAWNVCMEETIKTDAHEERQRTTQTLVQPSEFKLMATQVSTLDNVYRECVATQSTSLFSFLWYMLTSFIYRYLACHLVCAQKHELLRFWFIATKWNRSRSSASLALFVVRMYLCCQFLSLFNEQLYRISSMNDVVK